jgi:hypothetical protein
MARQARLDAPGTLHHVMIRGIEGSPIFKDYQDRQDFISRMGMLARETGTKIVAWVLTNGVWGQTFKIRLTTAGVMRF